MSFLVYRLRLHPGRHLPLMLLRFPRLFRTPVYNAKHVVQGFLVGEMRIESARSIRRILIKYPWILAEDVDDRLRPHVAVLKSARFTDVRRVIVHRPYLMNRRAASLVLKFRRFSMRSPSRVPTFIAHASLDLAKVDLDPVTTAAWS